MRSIELFAGAGGLGMGLSLAGFKPTKIVEFDQWCCNTLRQNVASRVDPVAQWPEPTEADVRNISFSELRGTVDLVSGGPPCQPFSLGGKHGAFEDSRDMWSEAVRAVRETQPKAFIFENVKGLTRASFSTYLSYVVHQLTYPDIRKRVSDNWADHFGRLERHHIACKQNSGLSYRLVYQVLNAANYGIPQKRERVVFVGVRSDLELEWAFPPETHSQDALLWQQLKTKSYWEKHKVAKRDRIAPERLVMRGKRLTEKPSLKPWLTVRDAIGDLPDPENDKIWARAFDNHRFQPGARSYAGHTGSPLDEPAKTLKAGVHGVPGGENMLCRPDGTVRYFSVRESARLQTFPDHFVLNGSWSESMRQLGNAVPVELARVVGASLSSLLLNHGSVKVAA
jgi:DNA (cytosine-5)-methyltransferase 1